MNLLSAKVQSSEGCRKEVFAEVSQQDFQVVYKRIFEDIFKNAQIAGFRKGNAPREIVEKQFNSFAVEQTIKKIIPEASTIAWENLKFTPVSIPEITKVDYNPGGSLQFSMIVDVAPEVNLPEYKNIKVKKQKIQVKDENIQGVLKELQDKFAVFKKVKSRAIQVGDYIRCDIVFTVPGVGEEKQKGVWFFVDASSDLREILFQLVGLNTGATKEIDAKVPKRVGKVEYWEKDAKFKINIREIMERSIPELNDELAKKMKFSNLEQLKEFVQKNVEKNVRNQSKADCFQQIIDHLLEKTSIDIPQSQAKFKLERLVREQKVDLFKKGVPVEEINKQEEKILEELKPVADRLTKQNFLLTAIAQKENLVATEEEVNGAVLQMAHHYDQKPSEMRKILEKENAIDGLYDRITEDKVLNFLLENANVEQIETLRN